MGRRRGKGVGGDVVEIRQCAPALDEPETVSGEQLVGDGEADVAEGQVVDEPPVGSIEERHRGQARRIAQRKGACQKVERETRVDDVLHQDDVSPADRLVEILEQTYGALLAGVPGELDQVDPVRDRERARQVGEEDRTRLERRDQQRVELLVVRGETPTELRDPRGDLVAGEVDLPDRFVRRRSYEASFSWYR
jgi:hypothetical protein